MFGGMQKPRSRSRSCITVDLLTVSMTTYLVVLVFKLNITVMHGVKNDSHRLNDIVEYYGLPFEFLALAKALCID